jgi:hypothetical protein
MPNYSEIVSAFDVLKEIADWADRGAHEVACRLERPEGIPPEDWDPETDFCELTRQDLVSLRNGFKAAAANIKGALRILQRTEDADARP